MCSVGRRAVKAAALFGTDAELLVAVGLLHDVGYAPDVRQAWPELLGAVERTEAALEASGSRQG